MFKYPNYNEYNSLYPKLPPLPSLASAYNWHGYGMGCQTDDPSARRENQVEVDGRQEVVEEVQFSNQKVKHTEAVSGKLFRPLITLIHTSFSPRTTLPFFVSIGSHNNKKSRKNFFGSISFCGREENVFFSLKTRLDREREQLLVRKRQAPGLL